jgi:glycerol-3-phosphate dehydrogenase (NAD(P)+)
VVLTAKGLEQGTLKRQSEVLAEAAPGAIPFVLSGPSFAVDVAAGRPTAVTLAGDDEGLTEAIASALAGPSFRPYAGGDRIGVELAGALKNVYALAAGAVDGAQLGASARAALIARAFAELSRIIPAFGGKAETLTGLAGLGDLTLSCTSEQSRNYQHGKALGRGEPLPASLAEGVFTAPVAQMLARQAGVDAPLIDAVNLLLTGNVTITHIVAGLMSRPLKRED